MDQEILAREKLLQSGAGSLSDAELLAVLLRTGTRGINVLSLAEQLLVRFGGVKPLLQATQEDLLACPGIGVAKFVTLAASLELAKRFTAMSLEKGEAMTDPSVARQFLQFTLEPHSREIFAVLFLDNQHRLIRYEELFFGTIDGASVHPREVVRRGLELNAAAVILAHNHPSGVSEPSQADRRITQRLQSALALLDIRVLDHIVVGDGETTSFAERGYL